MNLSVRFSLFSVLIAAMNGCGGSGDGNNGNITQVVQPNPPSSFDAASENNGDVRLSWSLVEGVDTYNAYYSTDPKMDINNYAVYSNSGWIKNITSPYTVKGLAVAPVYYFIVSAVDNNLESKGSQLIPIITRYEIVSQENDVVRDKVTNLEWQRCSLGQTWNKGTQDCDGVAGRYNTKIAFSYNGLSSGRWRLPSMAELKSLIYCVEDKKISFIGSSVKDYCPQKASITSGVAKNTFPNTLSVIPYHSSTEAEGYEGKGVYQMVSLINGSTMGGGCGRNCEVTSVHLRFVRDVVK